MRAARHWNAVGGGVVDGIETSRLRVVVGTALAAQATHMAAAVAGRPREHGVSSNGVWLLANNGHNDNAR